MDAALEPEVLAVAPGERGGWTLRLRNSGVADAVCRLSLTDRAAEWAWLTAEEVTVPAGEEATVRVAVRLPPPPSPAAGRVLLTVEVRTDGAAPVACSAALDVLPVVDITASLGQPEHRAAFPLTVRNRGNVSTRVELSAEGATVEPAFVVVAPGDLEAATVSARGQTFTVVARPDRGEAVEVSATVPGRARRRPVWRVVVPVAIVALVAAAVVGTRKGSHSDGVAVSSTITTAAPSPDCPARDHLAADPAGLPRRNVPIPDGYSFLEVRPGGCQPVRFNPCDPVHYVTNAALAPPDGLDDLQAAFRQLSDATGIEFVDDGPSEEPAALNRAAYQPDRYGSRWAPILVVWAHGAPLNLAPTNPGGGRAINLGGVYGSGFLVLNVDAVNADRRPLPSGFGPGATWGRVMIHELGHLVGLGHVRTSREVMFDDLGLQIGQAEYHDGDRAGLRLVGREAGCLPTPPLPARR